MNRFFAVDRSDNLSENLIISLKNNKFTDDSLLQDHLYSLFPEGLSKHGVQYFTGKNNPHISSSSEIELTFEFVRRSSFDGCPSRFQSFFGFETIEQAQEFRRWKCGGTGSIWEIEAEKSFKADMNLLTLGTSILSRSYLAHQYWSGEAGSNPFCECLLMLPVRVLRKID